MIEVHWKECQVTVCHHAMGKVRWQVTFVCEDNGLALSITHLRPGRPAADCMWERASILGMSIEYIGEQLNGFDDGCLMLPHLGFVSIEASGFVMLGC
jgi:hypothetical protein